MILSLLRKCINAILLLWVISIIAFWLSKLTPGDEVMEYLTIDDPRYNINSNPLELRKAYELIAHRRGLDLPLFYWSVSPGYYPQDVNHILPLDDRKSLKTWIDDSKNGKLSLHLRQQLKAGLNTFCVNNNSIHSKDFLCQQFNSALKTEDLNVLRKNMVELKGTLIKDSTFNRESINQFSAIVLICDTLLLKKSTAMTSSLFPLIEWNGTHSQYHQWMSGLLSQRPLTSLVDGLNAWGKIYDALKWTLLLNGLAFLLAILLGVGIGIWSGTHDGHPAERILNWILFALFALPSFWLGTLFIYALTSGEWLSLFPSGGLGPYHSAGTMLEKWTILFSHLILPVTCLALGALAYVSRQMKQSILHQSEQLYVKALRAQGISERTILRKHVIRNALYPVITIIGGSIPALLSGSLIIEVIYSIPGMGRLMYNSLLAHDWPVVFPVLMLGAAITVFSYLLTDIVYKWADPRVKTLQS
ncbi:MAG TPA: ABC transporter permease [Saprospiraceae bacterium]|nr:ABC transporter permease [Saprospiraceae bacterium]